MVLLCCLFTCLFSGVFVGGGGLCLGGFFGCVFVVFVCGFFFFWGGGGGVISPLQTRLVYVD